MPPRIYYVIDTSAIIDFEQWYPKSTFPSLWAAVEQLSGTDGLHCPQEVRRELEERSPDIVEWLKANGIIISDQETVELAPQTVAVDNKYPKLKVGRRRSVPNPRSADPWIVALALNKSGKVICSEGAEPGSQSVKTIPDACRLERIECLTLPLFFQELGLRF